MENKKESVRAGRKNLVATTQNFLEFGEINDDLITTKNGGVRAILKCSTINFNLKSEEEQKSIISGYQGFLNLLDFPIQIYIRSKKIDIDNYIESINKIAENQENQLLQNQTYEYTAYIKKLVEYANIMDKQFYVIVPVGGISTKKTGFLDFLIDVFGGGKKESASDIRIRLKRFEKLKKRIKPRINTITEGLSGLGIQAKQISTNEIIKLFYEIYNPDISRNEKNIY
ncbi:hypothetical protein LR002_00835 [Candidatus Gracilibacteria bacterium]|nr:hypothetical protein [Candidatus Gracilibacteria bacterium]